MSNYSAKLIADYLLASGDMYDALITNLKIQKLLYYAQGFHLAIHDSPLFNEQVKAWAHGPVVVEVYNDFKHYGKSPIDPPSDSDFSWDDVDDATEEFLDDIWDQFAKYSAWKLREMTHAEPPWQEAHSCGRHLISRKALKRYFQTRI